MDKVRAVRFRVKVGIRERVRFTVRIEVRVSVMIRVHLRLFSNVPVSEICTYL